MQKFKLKNILICLSIVIGFVFSNFVFAQTSDELSAIISQLDALNEKKSQCLKLSGQEMINCIDNITREINALLNRLKTYEKDIANKASKLQKDVQNLKNQISYLDAQGDKTEIQIRMIEQEINLTSLDISKTQEEIQEILKKIENTKKNLSLSLRIFYEYDKQNIVKITIAQKNFSDVFNEFIYIENIQKEIVNELGKLKENKKNLENKKTELEKKKEDLVAKVDSFNRQIVEMSELKKQRANLLEITRGDEAKYQEIMAEIATQKKQLLGDLAVMSRARQAEIEKLISETGGRLCNYFGVPYFAQDSGPWAGMYINNIPPPAGGTMANYGCAITSVAMILKYYGVNVNPGVLAQDSRILTGILIKFYDIGTHYGVSCKTGCAPGSNINWGVVDQQLENRRPVILMISAPGGGTHFIVAVGKTSQGYIVNDPISGVGCGVNLSVSVQNIANIYGGASVTRMVIF